MFIDVAEVKFFQGVKLNLLKLQSTYNISPKISKFWENMFYTPNLLIHSIF